MLIKIALYLSLLFITMFCGCAGLRPITAPMPGIKISGHIYDEEGKPVSNCNVIFQGQNWPYSEAVLLSDETGRFYGENLISSQDWIGFNHPDFVWQTLGKEKFADSDDVKVVLTRKKEKVPTPIEKINLNLVVKNEQGNPIPQAEINYQIGRQEPSKKIMTDSKGEAILNDIPNPTFNYINIVTKHPDYASDDKVFFRKIENLNIEIILVKPFTITGKVLDAQTKQPINEFDLRWSTKSLSKGAVIGFNGGGIIKRIEQGPQFEVNFNSYSGWSGEDGHLYEVCARAEGYAWSRIQITYDPKEVNNRKDDTTIYLNRGVTLKGKVTDTEGRPIFYAICKCFDIYYDKYPVDERGYFKFENWPLYARNFSFEARGYRVSEMKLDELKEGQTVNLDIQLQRFDESKDKK